MINTNKLKGRIHEIGENQGTVSRLIGMDPSAFNCKLNGKRIFKITEVEKLAQVLSIPEEELPGYFFMNYIADTQ